MQSTSLAIMVALANATVSSAATFRAISVPAYYNSRATAISPDGCTIMGEIWVPGGESESFRWSATSGLTRQADLVGWGGYAWPYAMSYDGSVVVGYDRNPATGPGHAFKWTESYGREYLEQEHSEAFGVSWDGTVAVGYRVQAGTTTQEALIWRNGQGRALEELPGMSGGFATGVSATGAVVVGRTSDWPCPSKPFRWTVETGLQSIDLPSTAYLTGGPLVSADGSTVTGTWGDMGSAEAFVWTERNGAVGLGDLPGGAFGSTVAGLNANGQVIVGTSLTGTFSPAPGMILDSTTAFIWDAAHGMRSLPELLTGEYGLELEGWELWQATGISADGQTIVGNGISPDGHWGTWVVQVPEPQSAMLLVVLLAAGRSRLRLPIRQPERAAPGKRSA